MASSLIDIHIFSHRLLQIVVVIAHFQCYFLSSFVLLPCSGRIIRRFIPAGEILKPVLLECVTPVNCYWSLSLLVSGKEELMLVFKVKQLNLLISFSFTSEIWGHTAYILNRMVYHLLERYQVIGDLSRECVIICRCCHI